MREKLVERVSEFSVATEIGTLKGFAYVTPFDKVYHMALVHGRIGDGREVPTRLHRANVLRDIFGGAGHRPWRALRRFEKEGRGVIVILRDGSAGVPVSALPQAGVGSDAARQRQWREIGLGAQILKDLGISSIRLLTSAEHRYVGLAGFGIEIAASEPIASRRAPQKAQGAPFFRPSFHLRRPRFAALLAFPRPAKHVTMPASKAETRMRSSRMTAAAIAAIGGLAIGGLAIGSPRDRRRAPRA